MVGLGSSHENHELLVIWDDFYAEAWGHPNTRGWDKIKLGVGPSPKKIKKDRILFQESKFNPS